MLVQPGGLMTLRGMAAGLRPVGVILLALFAAEEWGGPARAAQPTHADAMAACRAKYGKKVINAIVNKDGTLTCQWQVVRPMTHAEAWEACRKKFGATQAFVQKKKDGWWCRYKARY